MDALIIVIGLAAIGIVVALRLLAGMNNTVGKIFRWFWNTSFKISSHIPFCGWMARFIIVKDETSAKEKEYYVQNGAKVDQMGSAYLDSRVAEQRRQEKENEMKEQELRSKGYDFNRISDDGNTVIMNNGEHISVDRFE